LSKKKQVEFLLNEIATFLKDYLKPYKNLGGLKMDTFMVDDKNLTEEERDF
jgi:hypothetical protein